MLLSTGQRILENKAERQLASTRIIEIIRLFDHIICNLWQLFNPQLALRYNLFLDMYTTLIFKRVISEKL